MLVTSDLHISNNKLLEAALNVLAAGVVLTRAELRVVLAMKPSLAPHQVADLSIP